MTWRQIVRKHLPAATDAEADWFWMRGTRWPCCSAREAEKMLECWIATRIDPLATARK